MPDNLESGLQALGAEWRRRTPGSLRARIHEAAGVGAAPSVSAHEVSAPRFWHADRVRGFALIGAVTAIVVMVGRSEVVARQVHRVLQALRIAPNTELTTYDQRVPRDVEAALREHGAQLMRGQRWHVDTRYGGFGGGVPEGSAPSLQRVEDPSVLRTTTNVTLLAPGGDYRGAPAPFHHALVAPDGPVFTFFGSGDRELMLFQAPVGAGKEVSFSRLVTGPNGGTQGVPPAPESLTIRGQHLTWDPDPPGWQLDTQALRWESAGVSYSLYGRALTRSEAVAVFSTLVPF